jgi:hypothetical protein
MAHRRKDLETERAPLPVFLSRVEFAKAAGLHLTTVMRLVSSGTLKTRIDGRRIVIASSQLKLLPNTLRGE